MNKFTIVALLTSMLFFAGCCNKVGYKPAKPIIAKKVVKVIVPKKESGEVILLPQEDGSVGKLIVYQDSNETLLDKAWQRVKTDNMSKKEIVSQELVQNQYKELFEAMPGQLKTYRLNFKFDSSEITDDSTATLNEILEEVKSSPTLHIDVIGFADRVGDEAYNKTLSMKRAKKVHALLESAGIDANIVHLDYYGESYPVEKTDDNTPSQLNRRVDVTIK